MERKKIIYFAAGPPSEAAADLRRLGLIGKRDSLRIVVPADLAPQLESLTAVPRDILCRYEPLTAPWLWLRLMAFLAFSGNGDILFFSPPGQWRVLKLLAWMLRGRVSFSDGGRLCVPFTPRRLLGHWLWRIRQKRERRLRALPVGVVGSASALYLRKILPVVRTRYPGVEIHALLPESLEAPAGGLFDSVVVLRRGFLSAWVQAGRFVRAHNRFQCWIVPCTNEPYHRMKWLAFLLPLAHRQIYNELADGFAIREPRMLYRHICWRLRDHLSFQIVAETTGRNWLLRLGHLPLYAVRLLAGVPVLWKARVRSASHSRAKGFPERAKALPRVDVLVFGSGRDGHDISELVPAAGSVQVMQIPNGSSSGDVNEAIRSSDAEFICLLDPECRIVPADWLHRLLESFDDQTAQVGPELTSPDGETLLRGLLMENSGALVGNADNAVRWHRRTECLEVDALPWICVLVRRQVLLEVGPFAEDSGSIRGRVDAEFCRRLAARGWRSLCNRSVTAIHPAVAVFPRAASHEVTEEIQQ